MAKEELMYKGSFLKALRICFEKNPSMTIGEILFSVIRKQQLGGQHFFNATDASIYASIERLNEVDNQKDLEEEFDEQEFFFWVERVMGEKK